MTKSKSEKKTYKPTSNWKEKILEIREVGLPQPVIPYSEFRKLYKPVERRSGNKKETDNF